ncbi:MAG TPA: YceI family protein [Steroidobacteraceae bacterium]|nr:YceI family protein [Steroidobacteraceae bacterium]
MHKFPWSAPMALILAACAAPQRGLPPPAPPPVAEAPAAQAAPAEGKEPWTVVASQLEVRVYRDGPMQKLGHDHIISSNALTGSIALGEPITGTSFELSIPLESLVVDDEAAREAAGGIFAAPVPQKDREATRHNMLGAKLLDAATQDTIRVASETLAGEAGRFEARVRVSIAGHESTVSVPFSVTVEGDQLKAHADFRLTHADLGLQPFTVALGALRVREDFEVDLTLEARRGS